MRLNIRHSLMLIGSGLAVLGWLASTSNAEYTGMIAGQMVIAGTAGIFVGTVLIAHQFLRDPSMRTLTNVAFFSGGVLLVSAAVIWAANLPSEISIEATAKDCPEGVPRGRPGLHVAVFNLRSSHTLRSMLQDADKTDPSDAVAVAGELRPAHDRLESALESTAALARGMTGAGSTPGHFFFARVDAKDSVLVIAYGRHSGDSFDYGYQILPGGLSTSRFTLDMSRGGCGFEPPAIPYESIGHIPE